MNKRELWLKLFHENDTALACAIHFCERFVTDESLHNGAEFIAQKKRNYTKKSPQNWSPPYSAPPTPNTTKGGTL